MIEVYTDGATNGTTNKSGAGIYIKTTQKEERYALPLGNCSNHEAEFFAIIKALEICQQQFPNEILSFRSDSKIVVDTIEKNYTKNETFKPLLKKINEEKESFSLCFIKWIPSQQNKQADILAKQAIQLNENI